MGITRKNKPQEIVKEIVNKSNKESSFTPDEAAFLTSKLREANYKGTEFETFYTKNILLNENK